MVQLTVRLNASSGRAPQLIQALRGQKRLALRQPGCSAAHISADVEEADAFWYCEEWKDADLIEDALRTDRFSKLLAIIETSAQPPLLEFRMVGETRGLEYVAAVRGAGDPPVGRSV